MTSELTYRAITADEFETYARVAHVPFGEEAHPDDLERWRSLIELDRSVAAFAGGAIVGTAGVFTIELTVPGGSVPMGGVTAVGVLPSHRRRGMLTEMMRRMLADCRERGEPLAGLWASESAIYGRYGYGAATELAALTLELRGAAFARPAPPDVRGVRLVDGDDRLAAVPPIYEQVRRNRPGMLDVPDVWWQWLTRDPEHHRDGAGPRFVAVLEDRAFAAYRIKPSWEHALANHTLDLHALFATDPEAYAAMWRWILDLDLVARLKSWNRPADEPLQLLLADPRQLGRRVSDALWLAVLDVPAALNARRYARPGAVTIEVVGAFVDGLEGTYRLETDDGGRATCSPGAGPPDLVLPAASLGAVYLGGTRFDRLAAAGLVEERTAGAVQRADAMFIDAQPWCPFEF